MTPDPTFRPVSRAPRGLARLIAGLALIAVAAACGPGGDNVTQVVPIPAQTSAVTATPDMTEASAESREIRDGGIVGPYTVRIPRIGVDARVVPIKSNEERILEPPRDPTVAGWWSDGAAPGEPEGSAVVVGHTVRRRDGGVFDDIRDLSRGDAIEVQGSDATLTYRVQSTDVLSKDEVARNAEDILAQTGPGRLVLITCDDWDGVSWRANVVIIATPV